MTAEFRKYLPDLNSEKWINFQQQTALSHATHLFDTIPLVRELDVQWRKLYSKPFKGITIDGNIVSDIYDARDDGIDQKPIIAATKALLQQLSPNQVEALMHTLSAPEWRAWSNPEIYMMELGLRLDEIAEPLSLSVLAIIQATLSPEGYQKAVSEMRINHFLGQLFQSPKVLNKYSYNFLIFGEPHETKPWGWLLYGHHLCMSVFLKGTQIVISPTFTGAEPNEIDEGEFQGTKILFPEEELGLRLMQRLTPSLQAKAQIYKDMHDPTMPDGRWNLADQRHLCGAFQDNRIVPYEGIPVSELKAFWPHILEIVEQFILYLPKRARTNRLKEVKEHLNETWFSWVGGYGYEDAFYYRIQSPVIIVEFDHHSGVFLDNEQPKRFHIHTIVRSPNGGDYGNALRNGSERLV
ncbi:hypothetical protein VE03_06883 [Pseudogymnoascus sp. 23342-1-I1]|nr:hypothetical protein VE03_06883 [Pseudogymnoascus sp. 23342-1-I1]